MSEKEIIKENEEEVLELNEEELDDVAGGVLPGMKPAGMVIM